MVADADLQVWLDMQAHAGQRVIIPYVKSVKDAQVKFLLEVVQQGPGTTSRISQQGQVNALASKPVALSRAAIGMQSGAECHVELSLHEDAKPARTYRFDC